METAIEQVLSRLHARMEQERVQIDAMPPGALGERIDEFMLAIGEDAGRLLNLLAKTAGSRMILEVGTSVGYSTLWLAEAARENGGRVITIDTVPDKTAQARANLQEAGLADFVEFITDDALAVIGRMMDAVDLVLLDAWKDVYLPAFDALHPKLTPGGLIAADNIIHPDSPNTKAYQQHVRAHPAYDSVLVPIGNRLELSRKKP